jgi:hypothetical protein
MVEIAGNGLNVTQIKRPLAKVMVTDRRPELTKGQREICILHLPRQRVLQALP